jgi:spore coat protein JC
MWTYERRLEYPLRLMKPDARAARVIMSQYGGPNGELGASLRYLAQRYSMTDRRVAGLLTDIGTEELAHLEMICTMIHQLTRGLTPEQLQAQGFTPFFTDHTLGAFPADVAGNPFTAAYLNVLGDPIADLSEDMAAEQKARVTYDNILLLVDDPDVKDAIRFLREREVVHYQRFGEALELVKEGLDKRNLYAINPSYDKC